MQQPSRTVLIVDDSLEDCELYRRYLQRDRNYSYTILEASLGRQGLELWQQQRPDLVLLDYRLPDLDGLEFLAQLPCLPLQPCLPVILMTSQGNERIAVQAMKAGAQDYLIKGQITPEALHLAVSGAIETVKIRTELHQRIERERIVGRITQQIHQSLDLERILQTTVTEVRQFLNTDRVLVFQLQPDGNGTVVAESVTSAWRSLLSSTIYDPCLAEYYLRFSRPGSITYDSEFVEDYVTCYRQGRVTAIPDIHGSGMDSCHIELLAQFQVNANLVVPILHDDGLWGLLIAHHCAAPRLWLPLEIDLLKDLATQLGIALRQAELYQQSQTELAERKRVEAELRASEERLRSALEASRMGTWDWNIETGQIQWSANLEAMFGLEPGAFDGSFEMFTRFLHPDDRDRVLSAVEQAISTGEDYTIEFRVVYPNGTVRWALSQGKVFYGLNGQPVRMTGNDIDITERKQTEIALQESESRFRQLTENIDAVFWMREVTESRASYVSPAYERLWGLNPQELYENQQAWVNYIHPDDREPVYRAFQAKAAEGLFDEEYRIILPNGQIRWVHDRCFPLRNEAGALYRFTGIAEDITDRKGSEQTLQKSEERFRTSVENMLDCFAIYQSIRNEQGEIVDFRTEYVNDAACLNNQMTREQQIGRGLCELLPGHRDSGLFDEYCQVVETGQALVKENLIYEDDYGQQHLTRAFDIRVAKLEDGFIATWRDITDRKRAEVKLLESERQLRIAKDAAALGIHDYDITSGTIQWDARVRELWGVGLDEPITHEVFISGLHPEDRAATQVAVNRALDPRGDGKYYAEYRVTHRIDGLTRWIAATGIVMFEHERAVRLVGTVQDITARKQAEQEAQEGKQILDALMEYVPEGITIADAPNVTIRRVSRYGQQLTGRSLNVIEGIPVEEHTEKWGIFYPDGITPASNEMLPLTRAVQQGEVVTDEEWVLQQPDGTKITILCNAGPIYVNDKITGGVIVWRDISERKWREQQQEYLLNLNDALRPLSDAVEIEAIACRLLGEHLGVDHVFYAMLNEAEGYWNIPWQYSRGTSSMVGDHPASAYSWVLPFLRCGDPVIVADIDHSDIIPSADVAVMAAIQTFAIVSIPLIKGGTLIGTLSVTENSPRVWQPEEVELVLETAERTWAAVERARAEMLLRASHNTFRHLVENSPFGVYVIDADFRLAQVSAGAQKVFENVRPLIGRDFAEVLQIIWLEPFASEAITHFRHTLKTGEPYHAPSIVERRQDTDEVESYDWKIERITLPDGRFGVVCHFYDLSERLHYEAALRDSEERFRNLADHMSQLAWMADEHGWVFWYNHRWFEYTGTTLEEMQGWGWQAVHHPDHVDRVVQHIRHCFEMGEVWEDTFPLRGHDGQYRWFLSRAIPIRDQESGQILRWFGTNTDITERKQAEQERQRLLEQEQAARAEAERANQIKDEFLAILSHELRSPLNPILGWTQLLQSRKFDPTKTNEALATIERNAKLQTQLIDDLLDTAKILRGKLTMNVVPVDLAFVIEAAIDTMRTAAVAKEMTLHAVLPQIGRVSGDSARLQQIVWNLLSNAIKFTPAKGVVEVRLEREGDRAKITISDTGKGINPDFLPHLFESFRQEDASTTRQYGGLGLGLAIVRHLVEAHGGTIYADSPGEGQGATFIVQFPLLNAESEQPTSETASINELDLTGIRILAVDDELDARELLTELLTQYGAEVLMVTSAPEALTHLESFQPSVLISDIGMSEVDGYMLMQQIRALPPEKGGRVLAIALTAYAGEEDCQQAIASGYQRHLTKPLDLNQLVKVVVELTSQTGTVLL